MKCKTVLLAVVLIILMTTPALAEWSGTVIVDKEYSPEQTKTIYTLVLDYSIRDWWYLDFVLDHHPAKGTDADISTTFYALDVFPSAIYVTVGVRGSVWRSDTPVTMYWRLAFKF